MNYFVNKQELVDVNVYVFEENGRIEAVNEEKDVPKDKKATKLLFQFKRPNNKDSNNIMKKGHKIINDQYELNNAAIQEEALRILLADWNLTDENGNKIEYSVAKLESLDPAIARTAFLGLISKVSI